MLLLLFSTVLLVKLNVVISDEYDPTFTINFHNLKLFLNCLFERCLLISNLRLFEAGVLPVLLVKKSTS